MRNLLRDYCLIKDMLQGYTTLIHGIIFWHKKIEKKELTTQNKSHNSDAIILIA